MARDVLAPEVANYLKNHSSAPDAVQRQLIERTTALGRASGMQIGTDQGAFLEVLVGAIAPGFAVEVGTFTGYSSLSIARAMPADGRLLCCDVSEKWTDIAREHWELAGVSDRIDLRIGPATETLASLGDDVRVDFAFIDADKTGYRSYYEALLPLMGTRGVIAVDNTLWGLSVLDDTDTSDDTVAIRDFNDFVAADPRVVVALLPIGDGVTLIHPAGPSRS